MKKFFEKLLMTLVYFGLAALNIFIWYLILLPIKIIIIKQILIVIVALFTFIVFVWLMSKSFNKIDKE